MDVLRFWAEQVNRVGIATPNTTYCVNVTFVNIGAYPNSSTAGFLRSTVRQWALQTAPTVHFFVAPFGSPMTLPVFQELDIHGKIVFSPSASAPVLYQCSSSTLAFQPECASKPPTAKRFEAAFGLQPPATLSAIPFMNLAQLNGAKTVAYYVENTPFSLSLIQGAQLEAATYGLTQVAYGFISNGNPSVSDVATAAQIIANAKPDVVIGGTTQQSCIKFMAELGQLNWVPKGGLFSLCASDPNAATIAPNSKYFTDYVEWDRRLTGYQYIDDLYFPPTNTTTSAMLLFNAFTARYNVTRTSPPFGTLYAAGVAVRSSEDGSPICFFIFCLPAPLYLAPSAIIQCQSSKSPF